MHEHSNGGFKFYDFCDYILFLNLTLMGQQRQLNRACIYKNLIDDCKDYIYRGSGIEACMGLYNTRRRLVSLVHTVTYNILHF